MHEMSAIADNSRRRRDVCFWPKANIDSLNAGDQIREMDVLVLHRAEFSSHSNFEEPLLGHER